MKSATGMRDDIDCDEQSWRRARKLKGALSYHVDSGPCDRAASFAFPALSIAQELDFLTLAYRFELDSAPSHLGIRTFTGPLNGAYADQLLAHFFPGHQGKVAPEVMEQTKGAMQFARIIVRTEDERPVEILGWDLQPKGTSYASNTEPEPMNVISVRLQKGKTGKDELGSQLREAAKKKIAAEPPPEAAGLKARSPQPH